MSSGWQASNVYSLGNKVGSYRWDMLSREVVLKWDLVHSPTSGSMRFNCLS